MFVKLILHSVVPTVLTGGKDTLLWGITYYILHKLSKGKRIIFTWSELFFIKFDRPKYIKIVICVTILDTLCSISQLPWVWGTQTVPNTVRFLTPRSPRSTWTTYEASTSSVRRATTSSIGPRPSSATTDSGTTIPNQSVPKVRKLVDKSYTALITDISWPMSHINVSHPVLIT